MQASTRIGIALCVLVAGATLAGLFRKLPEPVLSPADRSESQLALRQPGPTPVMSANAASDGRLANEKGSSQFPQWGDTHRSPQPGTEQVKRNARPPLSGVKMADRNSVALPVPTMPEVSSSHAASGDPWNAKTFRPT